MYLSDIMTRDVEVVHPATSLQEAAQLMRELDVGLLPICDGERLVGMLTDRDITIRATAEGRDPSDTPVSEVMSQEVVYCFEDQDLSAAAELMSARQIRRLPVLNRSKQLTGIVSLGDLATMESDKALTGETLDEISQPGMAKR